MLERCNSALQVSEDEAATLYWPDNLDEAGGFHAEMEGILQAPVSYTKLSYSTMDSSASDRGKW